MRPHPPRSIQKHAGRRFHIPGCLVVLPTSWTRSISTEKTATNAASCLSGWSPLGYILHITGYRQSIHHNFSVGIYAKSFRKNRRLFWFDQIALFPKTIVNESHFFSSKTTPALFFRCGWRTMTTWRYSRRCCKLYSL